MTEQDYIKVTSGVKLIGVSGHAGAGKDTVKDFLIDTYKNHYSISLADPLKEAASAAFGIPLEHFYLREIKEIVNPNWGKSPREIAQYLGTEMFRNHWSSNFWLVRATMRLNNLYVPEDEGEFDAGDTVVIPDIRFQNEYNWIIDNGGIIIHLTRPGADGIVGIPNHASEEGLEITNPERTYSCLNDSSITALHRKIADIVIAQSF